MIKKAEKALVLQHGQSDCGVACLLSIIKYYGGNNTLENLRKLSGTNITGTTLLGLYQAALVTGFDAEGCEANVTLLTKHKAPCILYVRANHYVVCFGTVIKKDEIQFIIGDPAKGVFFLNKDQVDELWETKKCLEIIPNEKFQKNGDINARKREWVINLIKKDTPLLVNAAALGIAIATLSLTMAIFSQKLIDEILPRKEFTKLNLGVALLLVLLLVKETLCLLRAHLLLLQSKDFNIRIIDFFYNHLLQLPKFFFDTRRIGELTARLNDTARIQKVISQLAGNVIIDVLTFIVSISFVFIYSWKVGIACLIISPFYYLLISLHNNKVIEGQRAIMVSYALTEANYISTLQGIEPIKNYNKQTLFSNTNKKIYQAYQGNIFSLGKIQIKLSFLANTFSVVFLIAVLFFTSYQVVQRHLKIGELMAILGMCGALLPSIANLALVSIPVSEAKIAFDRMFEFTAIDLGENGREDTVTSFKKLEVQDLSFRFVGRPPVIKNISFEVTKGEVIAIMGENGCGKSTITQILQKNYINQSGSIIVNDSIKLNDFETSCWRKLIGVVPQNLHLFSGTILENIAFEDAQNKPDDVLNFLEQYGFTSFINSLPQSFMTVIGEEGVNLSGGQKQIIALARALYFKPQLLILDEATAAMDRHSEQFVLQLLQQLKKEMGIIFITHRLHVLKFFCDKIYIIEKGVISTSGTHGQLMQTPNMYSLYWKDLETESLTYNIRS
jgi:ATP-binding cassette subfamily B protein